MHSKIVSAGIVYFYLCGILKDDQIELSVVDSYRGFSQGFYDKIRYKLCETEAANDVAHIFGVIGDPDKVDGISSIIKAGFQSNIDNVINRKPVIKKSSQLDEMGNAYFKIIQEFFLEEPDHFPYALNREIDEWNVRCIWCSNAERKQNPLSGK